MLNVKNSFYPNATEQALPPIQSSKQEIKILKLDTIEKITHLSFLQLISAKEKKGLPYILAVVDYKDPLKERQFYDALALKKMLGPDFKCPLTQASIQYIHYFKLEPKKEAFTYVASIDRETPKKQNPSTFLLAASKPHTLEGQYRLGTCYEHAICVKRDLNKAFEHFEKALKLLNAKTLPKIKAKVFYKIARCYHYGQGVLSNESEALKFYYKAALEGHEMAAFTLGSFFLAVKGKQQNNVAAFQYFSLAAKSNHPLTHYKLALCYQKGIGIEKNDALAAHYFTQAAHKDFALAQVKLANCYRLGKGVLKSHSSCFELCKLAASQKAAIGQYFLAYCYEYAIGTDKNMGQAVKFYKRAAKQGYSKAVVKLQNLVGLKALNATSNNCQNMLS